MEVVNEELTESVTREGSSWLSLCIDQTLAVYWPEPVAVQRDARGDDMRGIDSSMLQSATKA